MSRLLLPRIIEPMTLATVEAIHVAPGAPLKVGDKLMDLSVDLGGAFLQNCPPISYYRLVLREAAVLRRLCVSLGDRPEAGAALAEFGQSAEADGGGPADREVRIAIAGILPGPWMWSEQSSQ
jgi:hypothetical protein